MTPSLCCPFRCGFAQVLSRIADPEETVQTEMIVDSQIEIVRSVCPARDGLDLERLYDTCQPPPEDWLPRPASAPLLDTVGFEERITLERLPMDVIMLICGCLLAPSLRRLSHVNRWFRALLRRPSISGLRGGPGRYSLALVPGLHLPRPPFWTTPKLLPHQLLGALRMLTLERGHYRDDVYRWIRLEGIVGGSDDAVGGDRRALYISRSGGKRGGFAVTADSPPPLRCGRGGVLGDGPGLGKTVTVIAAVLTDLGRLSRRPPGEDELRAIRSARAQSVWMGRDAMYREQDGIRFAKMVEEAITEISPEGDERGVDGRLLLNHPLFASDRCYSGHLRTVFGHMSGASEAGRATLSRVKAIDHEFRDNVGHAATLRGGGGSVEGLTRAAFWSWIELCASAEFKTTLSVLGVDAASVCDAITAIAGYLLQRVDAFVGALEDRILERVGGDILQPSPRLRQSRATLVVVPPQLLEQWTRQIVRATSPQLCDDPKKTRSFPSLFGDDLTFPAGCVLDENPDGTPVVRVPFFDGGNLRDELPPADYLASCWIVLVSSARLRDASLPSDSALLRVNWVRLCVDEADMTGDGEVGGTNTSKNLHRITAEARWCISGTPTPDKTNASGLPRIRR